MGTIDLTFVAGQLRLSEFYTPEEFAREMATQTSLSKKQAYTLWNAYFALSPMERMELDFSDGVQSFINEQLNQELCA